MYLPFVKNVNILVLLKTSFNPFRLQFPTWINIFIFTKLKAGDAEKYIDWMDAMREFLEAVLTLQVDVDDGSTTLTELPADFDVEDGTLERQEDHLEVIFPFHLIYCFFQIIPLYSFFIRFVSN